MNHFFPNLFIPGAAKSGTSTLHEILNYHPDICMSSLKEPFFWVNQNFSSFTKKNWEIYFEFFQEKKNTIYRGESSTGYMLFPEFLDRIKILEIEKLKFIFILRNPIDRIYSHYWYLKGLGSEDSDLKTAILNDLKDEPNVNKCLPEGKDKHYFQYGLYGKWLSKFYDYFNPDQIKIVVFEDLISNPGWVANECFEFLGLNNLQEIPMVHKNETVLLKFPKLHKQVLKSTNQIKEKLRPIFKYFPKELKQFVKKIDLSEIIIKRTTSNKSIPKITDEERLWLRDLYNDDIKLLKSLTNMGFEKWQDFKS